jgi:hypothetical protein
MKALLAACVAFGAVTVVALPQAHADVRVGVPGVHLDVGPHDRDWHHRDVEHRHWEARRDRCNGPRCYR